MKKAEHWVFVVGWFTMGGAERQAMRFANLLQERNGSRITFIGLSNRGRVEDECLELGFNTIHWPVNLEVSRKEKLRLVLEFARLLRKLGPTYVAPYTMHPNLLCGLTWRLTGAKACVWQQRDEGRFRLPGIMEWLALKLTPAYISNSEHACQWLEEGLNVKRHKLRVITNGIELPDLASIDHGSWKRENGVSESRFVATMVANIHIWKDHLTLLRAWRLVVDKFQGGESPLLVLAGFHANAYTEVCQLIKDLQLEEEVRLPGVVLDVPKLLASTDLVLFSSITEGCPNGVLEGMAMGLPIVGTDIPAIREAVGESGIKFLAPPKDFKTLAVKILPFVTDGELRGRCGRANRQRIAECYSPLRMALETEEVFHRAAGFAP